METQTYAYAATYRNDDAKTNRDPASYCHTEAHAYSGGNSITHSHTNTNANKHTSANSISNGYTETFCNANA